MHIKPLKQMAGREPGHRMSDDGDEL